MNSKSEQILEAIDVLMDEKVSNLQFDKTIQAIVQSVEDVDTGEYKVEYNAGIISAFATDPKVTYKKGDSVYVTVPEGDFSNKKFISHRITNNSLTTGQYTELASTFFEVSPEFQDLGYIYIDQQEGFGLVAGPPDGSLDILNGSAATASTRFQAFAERYEYIQISAEFMTEFLEEHSVGDYGIKVIFENQEGKEIPYVLNLNAFNGDPYRLSTWSPQSTIIQIPKGQYKTLTKIVFYEEGFEPEGTNNNIFMQNLSLYFVEKVDLTEIPYYLNILPLDGIAFTTEQSKLRLEGQPYSSGELLPADNCIFQWFERDLSVTPSSAVYDKRAGWGWKGIVKDNLISFYEIKEASEKKVESIRLRRRLKGSNNWENVNTAITSDVYYDTKISSDPLVEYEYQYMLKYEDNTKSTNELISYTKEYYDANSLTIKKEQVPWQKSYKLVVVYNSTTLMTKEITLINLTFNGQVEIRQVNYKNSVTLELTNADYLGDWYYLASNGNQVKINEGKTSSVEVTNYLLYSPITFYCSVYQKQELGGQYLGELSYVMQSIESEDDVSVVFSGESFFSYDANGDINIYDAELERSLQVEITWKKGVISSASTIKCFDFEGNEIDEDGIDYQAKDSMLKKVRFDKEENTLYYVVKHKYQLTPPKNNTFQIQISTIDGQVYDFYKEIIFTKTGDPGTNGTRYQSLITIIQDNSNKNKFVNDSSSVKLNCKVYKDQTEFAIDGDKIVWETYNLEATNPQPDENGKVKGTSIIVKGKKDSSKKRYVKVTIYIVDEGKSTTLYDFFPVDSCDVQPNIDISRLPKYIQYNANGRNPQFRNSVSGFDALISSSDTNVITDVQCILLAGSKYCTSPRMTSGTAFIENDTTVINCSFAGSNYPDIIKFKFNTGDSSWYYMSKTSLKQQFKVVDEFNSSNLAGLSQIGLLKLIVLVTTDEQGTIQKIIDHPVPTYINTYGNEAIDGWDGTEVFVGKDDDKTHAIFAPQVGAGRKNSDNTFTGVVMGQDSAQEKIGLYGYQTGITSFALMEDGSAFFGKKESGRIWINKEGGDSATIEGGGGGDQPTGMTITLSAADSSKDAIRVGNGNFVVKYDGIVTAKGANIHGSLKAGDNSRIGCDEDGNNGWLVTKDTISSGYVYLYSGSDKFSNRAYNLYLIKDKIYYKIKRNKAGNVTGIIGNELTNNEKSYINFVETTKLKIGDDLEKKDYAVFKFISDSNEIEYCSLTDNVKPDSYYRIWSGSHTPSSASFFVTNSGLLHAKNAEVTGMINAKEGYIGGSSGWIIDSKKIYGSKDYNENGIKYVALSTQGNYAIYAGSDDINDTGKTSSKPANAPFSVTFDGKLTATSAKVMGEITAESGYIGNWKINKDGGGRLESTYRDEDAEVESARIYLNGRPTKKDDKVIEIRTSYKKEESIEDEDKGYVACDYGEFYVTVQGKMVTTNGEFHGTLKSSEGQIGGWIITKDKLYSENLKRGLASTGVTGYEEYDKAELESQHELLVPQNVDYINITLYQVVLLDKKTGAKTVIEESGYWLSSTELDRTDTHRYIATEVDKTAYTIKFRYSIGNYVIFSFTKESLEHLRYKSHPVWWKNASESSYGIFHDKWIDEKTTFKVHKQYIHRSWVTRDPSYKLEFVDNFVIWSGGQYREPLYRRELKENGEFQKIYILKCPVKDEFGNFEYEYREKQVDTPEDLTEEERAYIQEGIVFSRSNTYFGVTDNGKMYCSNAIVRGTVYAEEGAIGSWQIGTKQDKDGNVYQYLGAGGTELQSTGCIKITNSDEGQLLFFNGDNKLLKVDCEGMYYYGNGIMYINLTNSSAKLQLPPSKQIMIGEKTFEEAVQSIINN